MSPALDDLLAEESLNFTPLSESFDVERVAAAIASIGFSYRDEIEPSAFAIFSTEEGRDALRDARRADPTSSFPYVVLATVRPDVVVVFPAADEPELRVLSIELIQWIMDNYACRVENEFGTDMSVLPPKEEEASEDAPAEE
jgi:hypothetical protein